MRALPLFTLAAFLIAGAGCSRPQSNSSAFPFPAGSAPAVGTTNQPPGVIVTPGGSLPGKVYSVNPSARFAVLTFPLGYIPPVGQRLNVYRRGLKVGEVKITGPRRDTHIVADVVTGDCLAGDEIKPD